MNIKKSHSAVESFPAENKNEGIQSGVLLNMQEGGNEEITKDEFVTTSWDLADSKSCRKVPRTNSEIFNVLNKNYRDYGEPEFLKRLRGYYNGVSNVISCALQVIFTNNPKFAELSYNDFLNRTGLKDGCFSDQTFLNNKNAFKIISKIKDHDTREKLRNCGVSVVVKFLKISKRKDIEALIKKFLSGPTVSRSNAEKYLNSLFPTKKLSVRPEDAKSGSVTRKQKASVRKWVLQTGLDARVLQYQYYPLRKRANKMILRSFQIMKPILILFWKKQMRIAGRLSP